MYHNLLPQTQPQITFILPLFALLSVLGGLVLSAEMLASPIIAWFSLLYYGALCLVVMRYYPAAFLLLLWFIFLRATSMISGAMIESGGFMPEILQQGQATGAFARLTLIYTIGILGAIWVINQGLRYIPAPPDNQNLRIQTWSYGVFALTLIICAGIIGIGLQNGFPLIDGIDRFTYRKTLDSRFLEAFLSNRVIIAVLLGMAYAACQGAKKITALALFILLMIVSLLIAEKFTSISLMLIYFITPIFLLKSKLLEAMNRKIILLGFGITVITIPAILFVYGLGQNPDGAIKKFQNRASSQAQIWYLADQENDALFKFDQARIDYNIAALKARDPDALRKSPPYIGAADFMAQYLDKARYQNYINKGISLTLGMEGYLMKLFGWLGMIPLYLLCLVIYSAQLVYLAHGIISANPFRVILASKLLVWSDYGLKQGYLYSILGVKSLAFMAAIIAFEIMLRLMKRREDQEAIA